MRAGKNSRGHLWILLLVLAMLVVAQRVSFEDGRITWRPFGQARHSFVHRPCGIPIHMALGEVDPRFGFDRATVARALAEAAALWQAPGEAELFLQSDHPRAMAVSLQFDERQHGVIQQRTLLGGIDRNRSQLQSHEAMLNHWGERIEAARLAHENDSQALARRVRAHQAEVEAWNHDSPHARTEARRQALERENAAIRAAPLELNRALEELNRDIATYNQRVHEQRQQAEEYRSRVAAYNAYSSEQPIESGRYSYDRQRGRRIEVFRAADYNELVWIFAHELGHSLGLDHVDDPRAVMNELLHEGEGPQRGRARPVDLSQTDRVSLVSLCGDRLQPGRSRRN